MAPRVIDGRALGDELIRSSREGPVSVELAAERLGSERPFRARLIASRGRVPRGSESETLKWMVLSVWCLQLEFGSRSLDYEPELGGAIVDLWSHARAAAGSCADALRRIGGPRSVLVADLDRLTDEFDTWPPEVNAVIRKVDGVRPVLAVLARAECRPELSLRVLARLVEAGVLMVGSVEPDARESVVSPEPLPE